MKPDGHNDVPRVKLVKAFSKILDLLESLTNLFNLNKIYMKLKINFYT